MCKLQAGSHSTCSIQYVCAAIFYVCAALYVCVLSHLLNRRHACVDTRRQLGQPRRDTGAPHNL